MSNKSSLLPKGFGMPFVKVTDSQNKVIIDPLSELPIGTFITKFEYNYREEDDDECNITITTENPDLIDIPQFREQQYLGVQWGWVYSDSTYIPSAPRRVMIRDTRIRFSVQGINITLKCTDGFSITKSQQLAKNTENNFVNWIKQALTNNFRLRTFTYDAKKVKTNKQVTPQQYRIGYAPTVGLDALSNSIQEWLGLKEVKEDVLLKRRTFMQIGGTPYTALKDAVKYIPNGPYHVDGRDDGVTIHPTNFNQPPIAEFTWHEETGEIISFTVNTRKKTKAIDVAKKSQIDGETKSLDSGVTQTDGALPNLSVDGITGETIPSNSPASYDSRADGITGAAIKPEIYQYQDEEATKKFLEKDPNYLRKYAPEYLQKVVDEYKAAGNDPEKLASISLSNYTVKVKAKVKEVQQTAAPGSSGISRNGLNSSGTSLKRGKDVQVVPKADGTKYSDGEPVEVVREKEIELQLSAKDLLGYAGDVDSSKILAFNKVNDALQKQIEGSLVTIGQPNITSSKIITINNVSKKYSGDWYIKEINHQIDPTVGYITTMDLIKKTASNGTMVQSETKVNTQSLAMKVQKIANDLTPAEIAKAEEVKAQQDKVLQELDDMGDAIIYTNAEGTPVYVEAETDVVSLNKTTQTSNINKNDRILKDKTK